MLVASKFHVCWQFVPVFIQCGFETVQFASVLHTALVQLTMPRTDSRSAAKVCEKEAPSKARASSAAKEKAKKVCGAQASKPKPKHVKAEPLSSSDERPPKRRRRSPSTVPFGPEQGHKRKYVEKKDDNKYVGVAKSQALVKVPDKGLRLAQLSPEGNWKKYVNKDGLLDADYVKSFTKECKEEAVERSEQKAALMKECQDQCEAEDELNDDDLATIRNVEKEKKNDKYVEKTEKAEKESTWKTGKPSLPVRRVAERTAERARYGKYVAESSSAAASSEAKVCDEGLPLAALQDGDDHKVCGGHEEQQDYGDVDWSGILKNVDGNFYMMNLNHSGMIQICERLLADISEWANPMASHITNGHFTYKKCKSAYTQNGTQIDYVMLDEVCGGNVKAGAKGGNGAQRRKFVAWMVVVAVCAAEGADAFSRSESYGMNNVIEQCIGQMSDAVERCG